MTMLRDVISSPPFVYKTSHIFLEKIITNFGANALGTLVIRDCLRQQLLILPKPASQQNNKSMCSVSFVYGIETFWVSLRRVL